MILDHNIDPCRNCDLCCGPTCPLVEAEDNDNCPICGSPDNGEHGGICADCDRPRRSDFVEA